MSAWDVMLVSGTCGRGVYALARRPGALRQWEVRAETGAVVTVRATPVLRAFHGLRRLRLVELTLGQLRAKAGAR